MTPLHFHLILYPYKVPILRLFYQRIKEVYECKNVTLTKDVYDYQSVTVYMF